MKGKRSKRYPVPSGTQFTEGGETFTIVGPISDEQFVGYANRWPGANRLLRNRKDSPFLFASADTKHWVIFDEFGYPVSKSGIVVMDDIIGDGGSFTVGGYESHAEKYGDIQFLQRGFFNKLQEFRIPYAKNLAETERKIIAFSLSNDAPWRLQSYRKLGFEILPHTKKHPLLPDKYYQRFKRDATTYGVWVPNSLEDPAMKKAWEILKTNFYFDPDNPEGGHFDRNTREVHINLANKDAKRSINMSEDEYIENLSDILIEEYTHSAIDDEITSAFEEYLDYEIRNNTEKSPKELAAYGHTMHEIGANAARGYSKLGTWLTILGHPNPSLESKQWIVQNKLPGLIGPDLEKKIMQAYQKSKTLLPNSMDSPKTVYAVFRMDNGEELKSVME